MLVLCLPRSWPEAKNLAWNVSRETLAIDNEVALCFFISALILGDRRNEIFVNVLQDAVGVDMPNKKCGKILALANQKGGVGKTTTTVNLASALALLGKKVLVVDSDPQGNASSGMGVNTLKMEQHLYHCYMNEADVGQAIRKVDNYDNLFVLPTHIDLIGIEVELVNAVKRENFLTDLLAPLLDSYDIILIDCPPSLGLLTINAITAADAVIIPLQCEYYALEGLSQLVRTIRLVKNSYNHDLFIEGIILTMYDRRNRLTHQVAKEVKQHFKNQVYDVVIPRNVRLSESPSHGLPIHMYDKRSAGALSYMNLGKEYIERQKNRE